MAEVNGKIVICDRCGTKIFLRTTGTGESDGGYTRWNNFEPYPEGWGKVAIPMNPNAKSANAYNSYIHVCPDCNALWKRAINEGFLKGTKYYVEV